MDRRAQFDRETLPHFRELYAVARRLSLPGAGADDLVQETYLRALAAHERYRPGSNARAWLFRILVNAAHSVRRRGQRDLRLVERYGREAAATGPAGRIAVAVAEADTEAASGRVLAALGRLPPAYREVIELVDMNGLGYVDAARRLGVPIGTVMSRLYRGRRRLRSTLDGESAHRAEIEDAAACPA